MARAPPHSSCLSPVISNPARQSQAGLTLLQPETVSSLPLLANHYCLSEHRFSETSFGKGLWLLRIELGFPGASAAYAHRVYCILTFWWCLSFLLDLHWPLHSQELGSIYFWINIPQMTHCKCLNERETWHTGDRHKTIQCLGPKHLWNYVLIYYFI